MGQMGAPNPLLHVIPLKVDPELVDTLENLGEMARSGQLTGLCYVAICRGEDYHGSVLGRAKRCPAYALGLLAALKAQLLTLL
jgi:hypothetical protein